VAEKVIRAACTSKEQERFARQGLREISHANPNRLNQWYQTSLVPSPFKGGPQDSRRQPKKFENITYFIDSQSINRYNLYRHNGKPSECLPCRENRENTDRRAASVVNVARRYALYGTLMRDDENASSPKKKASRAFYPDPHEVACFDSWYSLQKTRIEEEAEEEQRKTEIWHIFEAS
jgi:hypothetical protein